MATILRLAIRDQAAFERVFDAQIAAFEACNPDLKVERHSFTIEEHYDRFISRRDALSGEYDLFLSVTDWIPQAVRDGLFEPLSNFMAEDPPPDWPDGWSPAMLNLPCLGGGTPYAIPWHDGPEVFHYRIDLFEDRQEKSAFKEKFGYDLKPPATWSQFVDVTRFFTRPNDGLWGCCLAGAPDGHSNVYDFLLQLWNRGGELIENGKAAFDGQPGWDSLQFLSDLLYRHKVASPDCLQLNSVQSGDYYSAAMMWNWCAFATTAELPPSKIIGKSRCTFLPSMIDGEAGVSLNIFWVLAMLSGSRHKEEAYRFIKHLCTPQMDKLTSMLGANGVRLSTWRDSEVQARFPQYEIVERVHRNTRSLPAVPEYPQINQAINQAVKRVMHERQDVRASLGQARLEVNAILGH